MAAVALRTGEQFEEPLPSPGGYPPPRGRAPMASKRKTSSMRLKKPYFDNVQEVMHYLQRVEGGRRRYTRSQIYKLVHAIETGWALAHFFKSLRRFGPVMELLTQDPPPAEFFPDAYDLGDASLKWLTSTARQTERAVRVLERVERDSDLRAAAASMTAFLAGHKDLVELLSTLSGESQVACAFAIRAAEHLHANKIEPAEMEALVMLVGMRGSKTRPEFGPNARPRRELREGWKTAMKKAKTVLELIDRARGRERT
jgi:hypothetical protein